MSLAQHSRDFFRHQIVVTARRANEAHDLRFIPWPFHNDNPIPAPTLIGADALARPHTANTDESPFPPGPALTPLPVPAGLLSDPFNDVCGDLAECGRAVSSDLLHASGVN